MQRQQLTRTVIDLDGTKEPKLIRDRKPFHLEIVPMPTTDIRMLAPWVAVLHIGKVAHA